MNFLVTEASQALSVSESLLTFKRSPDLAYIEYLVAYEIVVNRIPRHIDYITLQTDRGTLHRMYRDLVKKIQSKESQFSNIKEIIINDNRRSGILPETKAAYDAESQSRPSTADSPDSYQGQHHRNSISGNGGNMESSHYPSDASKYLAYRPGTPNGTSGRSTPADSSNSPRSKPPVRPKPENLHGRVVNGSAYPPAGSRLSDPLRERFAGLRSGANGDRPSQEGASSYPEPPLRMPSPSDFGTSTTTRASQSGAGAQPRPAGPRSIPKSTHRPPHPPKLPLDTNFNPSLPKEPSPTYSPARNMATPASIPPPRATPRSIVGSGGHYTQTSGSNSQWSGTSQEQSYFDGRRDVSSQQSRRASTSATFGAHISPKKLYDLIKISTVLLIDVRHRDEFDEGHIYAPNVMCIEPSQLREDMSADELEDSLVLSPDGEQQSFSRRQEYSYVVFYDKNTASVNFTTLTPRNGSEGAMKILYDALLQYNSKPLRLKPILLQGGLDAWIELLGTQSLLSSHTTATKAMKASRPARKAPILPGSGPIYDKAHREVPEMEPEEVQHWSERAQQESLPMDSQTFVPESEEYPMVRTTADFLRRFPDVTTLEKQSMVSPPSRPPPTSSLPTVPTRPAPAAPRVSYNGVHERDSTRYPTIRGPPQVSYNYTYDMRDIRIPKAGLVNCGNSCFMNSVVQALSGTLRLSSFLRDGSYRKYIQTENWKGSRGLVSQHFSNLLLHLWQNDVTAVRPSTFRNLMGRISTKWSDGQQQDAKEFWDVLIDLMHEDLNATWNNAPPHQLTPAEEAKRERIGKAFAAKIEWNRHIKRNESFITSLFGGQFTSRVKCGTCRNTSTIYEPFFSISVDIPRGGNPRLGECIDRYCAEDQIDGQWNCPTCNQYRAATKQVTFTRAPEILVFHFKRFDASLSDIKVATPVNFPLTGLDLGRWMIPPPTDDEIQTNTRDRGPDDSALPPSMTPPYIYNAYAVIRHIGTTITGGHYTALVKNPGMNCWMHYNDATVTEFRPEQRHPGDALQNGQAYLVFYERVRAT
ncbi:cysteine proteinase [Eremomyces bilateralis CBS 781.70]|uniref:Cysteine proteinase n=1 Tax=Eremomyces bilateralis CBS 781.70 TaxID=1392243 RepID=A0A6G1G1M2_9PEZI|nr:cysteine proteinase [Eremomyces bilateralis CBS 781.70]KAF1811882.1 cysteine proteinase [Eremomyces bilateralis CBS 781.70]